MIDRVRGFASEHKEFLSPILSISGFLSVISGFLSVIFSKFSWIGQKGDAPESPKIKGNISGEKARDIKLEIYKRKEN